MKKYETVSLSWSKIPVLTVVIQGAVAIAFYNHAFGQIMNYATDSNLSGGSKAFLQS